MVVGQLSGTSSRVGARRSIWDVPIAIWAYGLLRSLAFIAPTWSEDGRIGLGVVPVLVLFVFLVRGSRRAWGALVLFDIFSYVMLLAAWFEADDAPLAIPFLAGASMAALLRPVHQALRRGDEAAGNRIGPPTAHWDLNLG